MNMGFIKLVLQPVVFSPPCTCLWIRIVLNSQAHACSLRLASYYAPISSYKETDFSRVGPHCRNNWGCWHRIPGPGTVAQVKKKKKRKVGAKTKNKQTKNAYPLHCSANKRVVGSPWPAGRSVEDMADGITDHQRVNGVVSIHVLHWVNRSFNPHVYWVFGIPAVPWDVPVAMETEGGQNLHLMMYRMRTVCRVV